MTPEELRAGPGSRWRASQMGVTCCTRLAAKGDVRKCVWLLCETTNLILIRTRWRAGVSLAPSAHARPEMGSGRRLNWKWKIICKDGYFFSLFLFLKLFRQFKDFIFFERHDLSSTVFSAFMKTSIRHLHNWRNNQTVATLGVRTVWRWSWQPSFRRLRRAAARSRRREPLLSLYTRSLHAPQVTNIARGGFSRQIFLAFFFFFKEITMKMK